MMTGLRGRGSRLAWVVGTNRLFSLYPDLEIFQKLLDRNEEKMKKDKKMKPATSSVDHVIQNVNFVVCSIYCMLLIWKYIIIILYIILCLSSSHQLDSSDIFLHILVLLGIGNIHSQFVLCRQQTFFSESQKQNRTHRTEPT